MNITDVMPDLKAETVLNDNIPIGNESLLYDIIGSRIPEILHDTVTHVAKDLKPYTRYTFKVVGVTSAGPGESADVIFRTHEDRPGSSPTNLTYTNLTSTAVYLNWLEPKDPNGEIISYSVMYISKLSEMRTEVTNKTDIVLENLLKNSPYSVSPNLMKPGLFFFSLSCNRRFPVSILLLTRAERVGTEKTSPFPQ